MSRIGRMPIAVPAGVTVTIADDNTVTVKGALGTLTEKFSERMSIKLENNELIVTRPTDEKEDRSIHGLTRALLNNMVVGVTQGFSKTLEIIGVGYKATKVGKTVQLYLGHSLMKTGMPQVMNGLGIAIVSTSKGIMTDKKARATKIGGEVLAFVW